MCRKDVRTIVQKKNGGADRRDIWKKNAGVSEHPLFDPARVNPRPTGVLLTSGCDDVTGQVKEKISTFGTCIHTLVAGDRQTVQNGLNFGQTTLNYILKVQLEYRLPTLYLVGTLEGQS